MMLAIWVSNSTDGGEEKLREEESDKVLLRRVKGRVGK